MKKTIAEQIGIKEFPFIIKDSNDNIIYHEESNGFWSKREYNSSGKEVYFESSEGLVQDYRDETGIEFDFDFHLDTKHTIWYRSHFSVKAKTREEAIEKAKAMMVNFERDENSELLIDTTEAMSPVDNEGWSTEELFIAWECGDSLWKNGL